MKYGKLSLFLFLVFCQLYVGLTLTAQTGGGGTPTLQLTPNGIFDLVLSGDGQAYNLADLNTQSPRLNGGTTSTIAYTCVAGYFTLHFDQGSLEFANSLSRNVVCQVFNDISNMLISNAPAGGIHIYCSDDLSGSLAQAGQFFVVPTNPANINQGIARGQVEKYLITGVDPYAGIPISFFNANTYFHGSLVVAPSVSYQYDMTTLNFSTSNYDLYSVLLHEISHALGFLSFIDVNGNSKHQALTPFNKFYTQYDKYLCDHNGNPLLAPTNTACAISSLTFAVSSTSVLSEAMTTNTVFQNITTCSIAAQYIGATTATVHTPYFFNPSSLSHFEDLCCGAYTGSCVPTPTSPGANDLYFVTSNYKGAGPCYAKRHLTEEERLVLCDLGYSVNAVYGSTAVAGSVKSYTAGQCNPATVYGINDGLSNNVYVYTTTSASFSTQIASLLSNDSPSVGLTVECLEPVTSVTLSQNLTDFTVTAGIGSGLQVLKYYPKDSNGNWGNVTYVYIYFLPPGCTSGGTCNYINNGGFEVVQINSQGEYCGHTVGSNHVSVHCWDNYDSSRPNEVTGYLCGTNTTHQIDNLTSSLITTLSLGSTPNNKCMLMFYSTNATNGASALKNMLNTALTQNGVYQVSFWVVNQGASSTFTNINSSNSPVVISLASHTSVAFTPTINFPTGLTSLGSVTVNPGFTWTQVTHTFVYTNPVPGATFILGINSALSPSTANVYNCFIDQVSVMPYPGSGIPTSSVCATQGLSDIEQYLSPSGGTLTGTGLTHNSGQTDFNIPPILSPGAYVIGHTYSTTCLNTTYHTINVENCCNSPQIPAWTAATMGNTVLTGTWRFPSSFTITGNVFLSGEFMIAPNVSITVSNNAQLFIMGAHLYACTDMWEGIKVQSGGKVQMTHYNGVGNLIEDALTAVSVTNYTSSITPVLYFNNTVFNRNRMSIEVSNYIVATSGAFVLGDVVFTSRHFTFTPTSWPQATLSDLRSAAGGTNVLHGPYGLQSATPATLKVPHSGEFPMTAIWLNGAGNTTGTYPSLSFSGIQVGYLPSVNPEDHFNLFDCHRTFIKAYNSNLRLINNVFQNALTNTTEAAIHFTTTVADKQLDMSASQVNVGNRLFDFYNGVHAINACDLKIDNAIFRTSNGPNTSTVSNGYPLGKSAVSASSSRMGDFSISNSEFINFYFSVGLGTAGGTLHSVAVHSNTFSPTISTTFTGTTVNHLNQPIIISSPFAVFSPSASGGISIRNNLIHRGWNGIGLNGLSLQDQGGACGAQISIEGNDILLEEHIGAPLQRGIGVTNNIPVYSGAGCPWPGAGDAGYRSVKENTISLLNGNLSTTKISLFYTFNSAGISSPPLFMTCNKASDAHEGFSFEGYEPGVYWRGNKMENLARGMILKNGGVIGQQGTQAGTASDNEWLGSAWSSTNHGIYTSASQATNSPIVRWTSPAQFDPPNFWGDSNDPPQWYYSTGNGSMISYTGSNYFSCGVTYTQMPIITLPNEENYESDNQCYMAQTAVFRALHFNEDLRHSQTEYSDFHSLFESSIMEALAEIEFALAQQELTSASSMLAVVAAEDLNDVEQNYLTFYELFLAYVQSGILTENEQGDLSSLCALCPATDGACIFQARALYQIVTGAPFEAEPCVGDEGARKAIKLNEKTSAGYTTLRAVILPNPSTASVAIRLNKKAKGISVSIFDVSGRQVLKTMLSGESSQFELNFNLASGVYFFNISNDIENVTKKIIVAK